MKAAAQIRELQTILQTAKAGLGFTLGALVITYTTLGVPYYVYSIIDDENSGFRMSGCEGYYDP